MPGTEGEIKRRSSTSSIHNPESLNLPSQFTDNSRQAKPPVKPGAVDEEDEDRDGPSPSPPPTRSERRVSQIHRPSKSGLNYEPVHSESEMSDDVSLSDIESSIDKVPGSPIPGPGGRRVRRLRVGVSHNPAGRNLLQKKKTVSISDELDDTEICIKPLASRRNSGIVPLKLLYDSEGETTTDDESAKEESPVPHPANGVHKFSSRLKQKLQAVPIPRIFHKRKPAEYKLQAFVAILFLIITVLVGSIYVIHQEKILKKSYFDRIRFSSKDRRFRLSNLKGKDILSGVLGAYLTKKDKVWPCLQADEKEGYTCMEWMNKARLYLRTKHETTEGLTSSADETLNSNNRRCYEIYWQSLNPDFELKDCFNLAEKVGGHFYGIGEIPGSDHWPLNKTSVPYSAFLTGNNIPTNSSDDTIAFEWGRTLGRHLVNSDGAAIKIASSVPLHVSINDDGDRKICIGSSKMGYDYDKLALLNLNYTICLGRNVKDAVELLTDKSIYLKLKHDDIDITRSLAQLPIWKILPETMQNAHNSEASFLNYSARINALHLSEGYILLDESWQQFIGDLDMDSTRFPTMAETLNITRRRGFKVALTVQPFFSTQSHNFEEGLNVGKEGIWLSEKQAVGKRRVPALTQYKNWTSMAVLDVTKPHAQRWLQQKISALAEKYNIDALYADLGTTNDLPQFFNFSNPLSSADHYKDYFLKALRALPQVRTIGVSSAVKLPKLPTFVSLSPTESSWAGLQSVIPNILGMGVAGYPFTMPGSIGGDFFPDFEKPDFSYRTSSKGAFRVPDRELYIRWLELAHFLPVVQYSYLPSDYDTKVVDIATNMYVMRKKLYPYIKKAIDQSLTTGLPIIRPLWMLDPTDPNCLKVSDEFSIGEDVVVAPVLHADDEERDIYLPKGMWKNEIDGSPTRGEKWLHHYRVKENQIAFFTKVYDVPTNSDT